jgi:hypothetical protein
LASWICAEIRKAITEISIQASAARPRKRTIRPARAGARHQGAGWQQGARAEAAAPVDLVLGVVAARARAAPVAVATLQEAGRAR